MSSPDARLSSMATFSGKFKDSGHSGQEFPQTNNLLSVFFPICILPLYLYNQSNVFFQFRKSRSVGAEKKHVVVERFARILIAVMFIGFNGYSIPLVYFKSIIVDCGMITHKFNGNNLA